MLKCFIRSDREYLPVELRDGKSTSVGRSVVTRIKSKTCSRNQLELIPNYAAKIVTVKQTGPNDSAVNGEVIGQGLYVVAKDQDVINVVAGEEEFNYKIMFESNGNQPEGKNDSNTSSKSSVPNGLKTNPADKEKEGDNPKPVKIPKMFLPKGAEEFKKESLLPKGTWESIESDKVIVYTCGETALEPKTSVHSFDMDGTIITTKSGRVFPKDDNDWKFLYGTTVATLQKLIKENKDTKFVIITNQGGIEKGNTPIPPFKKKIEAIVRQIGVSATVFVLTGKNEFRKPLPNIWNLFVKNYNDGISPDMSTSVYCGDACGRKKDHSKADRLFALNIGIPFLTPEEFFLKQKPQPFTMPAFDPTKFMESLKYNPPSNEDIKFAHGQEMIVLVGFPGSGKSVLVKSMLAPKGYVHINRDTLKTAAKCKSTAEASLSAGSSVAVDNTNPTAKDRQEYIQMARKHGIPCRCFIMKVTFAHALHNNRFRELTQDNHAKVPDVAFHSYNSKFQEPTATEGFSEIVEVNFVSHFSSEERKRIYSLYLLEK